MIKEMNGYKVLTRANRESCIMDQGCCSRYCSTQRWTVQYPKNKEAFPNIEGSKLFFFKDKKDAEDFSNGGITLIDGLPTRLVVPCIAKNVVRVKWVCHLWDDKVEFWKKRSRYQYKKLAPKGTYLAESITCLE
jgi:hypothetical protein